jgi:hypothetical protein
MSRYIYISKEYYYGSEGVVKDMGLELVVFTTAMFRELAFLIPLRFGY